MLENLTRGAMEVKICVRDKINLRGIEEAQPPFIS